MKILNSYKPELRHPPENPFKIFSSAESLVFLLRHGQIQGSDKKRFIGRTDVGLDETGINQALYWKKALSPVNFDRIYASTLHRCAYTAGVIADGKKVTTAEALNEIDMGEWDGQTFDHIRQTLPLEFEKRGQMMERFRPPCGESFQDVAERVYPFFEAVISTRPSRTLMVTHAGVIRVILCRIMDLPLKDLFKIKLDYGRLFILSLPASK